jgi:hypothetical protein
MAHSAPIPPSTWLRINEVFLGQDLEDESFKFIELRYIFDVEDLPPSSKRPRMQAIEYRVGIWDLQTNRLKLLNYIVNNQINSDYIVCGSRHEDYPEDIENSFNIIVEELPDKYNSVYSINLFSCKTPLDWDALVFTGEENLIGKLVDDIYLDIMKECLIDAIVIGNAFEDNFDKITELVPAWKDIYYILDDTDVANVGLHSQSLGRCSDDHTGFKPSFFKRSPISMGMPNICTADYNFFIDNADFHNEMIGYNDMVVRRDNEVRQVENPLPDLILDEIPQQCIDKWILIPQLVNIKFLKQPEYKKWLGCSDNPADNKLYCRVCIFTICRTHRKD